MDARGDEVFMLMTYEQQGIYRALLDQQWVEGSIPSDERQLATILRLTPGKFKKCWTLISAKFQQTSDGRLINIKLDSQRKKLDAYIEEQQKRGQIGGRRKADALAVATLRLGPTLQPNPSSSITSSSSTEKQKPSPAEKAPGVREFLTWWQTEYRTRRNGATYFIKWDAHGAIVKRLLTTYGIDRLKKHAQILLTTDEEWTTGTDRGIEILMAKISWLEERLCAWEVKRKAREAV